jgi:hypothetical protein
MEVPEVKRIIRDSMVHHKHRRDTKYVPTSELPALIRGLYEEHSKIPVKVIHGDSRPHVDKAHDGKAHKRTSLLYLEGDGHLFLEDKKIPIRPGLYVEFDAGVKHWTEGSEKPKVLLGPMSERGGPVGWPEPVGGQYGGGKPRKRASRKRHSRKHRRSNKSLKSRVSARRATKHKTRKHLKR